MKILGVIPARFRSTRMPGKPLADICGKPMIWWVYQNAGTAENIDDIVIATDDVRIYDTCCELDMQVIMTDINHDTPTSRLYEVSTKLNADCYLMIMGDEPLVNAECFQLIIPSKQINDYYVAALTNVLDSPAEVIDFSNQKVVVDSERNALMISRSPLPYPKGTLDIAYEKVTGVQLFSKKSLEMYNMTPQSKLEQAEENDLLRFIENSMPVKMIRSQYKTISVDTEKDLNIVRKLIAERENCHGRK